MKPGDLVILHAGRGEAGGNVTYMWALPGDGSDKGHIIGELADDTLGLVLVTEPGPAFGVEEVLILVRGIFGWVWKGNLKEVGP